MRSLAPMPYALFAGALLAALVGASRPVAARPDLGIGLPADSLPPSILTVRSLSGDGRPEERARLVFAHHDSLAQTGDTLGLVHACAIEAVANARWDLGGGRDSSLLGLYRRALDRKRAILGEVHPEVARTLSGLARCHGWGHDDFATADSLARRAERVIHMYYGPDHVESARMLQNRASWAYASGDFVIAEDQQRRALHRLQSEAPFDTSLVATGSINLAVMLSQQGRDDEALTYFERAHALRLARHGRDHRLVARAEGHLASGYASVGDYVKARRHMERGVEVITRLSGEDHEETRHGRGIQGRIYYLLGDQLQAREMLLSALPEDPAERARSSPYGGICNWLGLIGLSNGRLEESRRWFESAIEVQRRTLSWDHPDVATTLEPFAVLLGLHGEFDSAFVLIREAKRIHTRRTSDGHSSYLPTTLLIESGLHATVGDLLGARTRLHEALAEFPDSNELSDPLVRSVRLVQAKIELREGSRDAAIDRALALARASRLAFRKAVRDVPERWALRVASTDERSLEFALHVAQDHDALGEPLAHACLDELVRSRALVLDAMAAERRRSSRWTQAAGGNAWQRWDHARRRWHAFRLAPGKDLPFEQRARIALALQRDMEREESVMIHAAIPTASDSTAVAEAGLREIRSRLPPGTALVSYVRVREPSPILTYPIAASRAAAGRYAAFVTRGTDDPIALVSLGDADSLESRIRHWQRQAGRPIDRADDADLVAAGAAVRAAVWDPLAPHLGGADQVLVVPDGMIGQIDLGTLPAANHGWLIEQRLVVRALGTERDLLEPAVDSAIEPRLMLAVGDVDYEKSGIPPIGWMEHGMGASLAAVEDISIHAAKPVYRGALSECWAFADRRFVHLPGSEAEVADLARLVSSGRAATVEVLRQDGASEARVKHLAQESRVMHLATHGFAFDSNCPGGVGGPTGGATSAQAGSDVGLIDNPLTRCGLALAGANRRDEAGPEEDDGLLTGDEIAALDLSGVEFVILSACNTGLGDVLAGEGVLGLQRAFKIAGAGPVVMSLWPVEDQVARQWMRKFYEARLSPGVTTSEATRRASLAILAERRRLGLSTRPSMWAPFVAVGIDR